MITLLFISFHKTKKVLILLPSIRMQKMQSNSFSFHSTFNLSDISLYWLAHMNKDCSKKLTKHILSIYRDIRGTDDQLKEIRLIQFKRMAIGIRSFALRELVGMSV